MNRRNFVRSVGGISLGAAAEAVMPRRADAMIGATYYSLSIMLWTVFRDLPIEQRLDKVVEAGYKNVELIGEYKKWSEDDFKRVLAKQQEHGITFDTTAGLKHTVGNPADRDALLADITAELPILERLGCPSLIVMSGNVVPGMPREVQHQSCIAGLTAAVALVEGKKINGKQFRLLLENIDPEENPKYYMTSVAEGFEIVRAVDHPQVRLLYDFYHEQISEGNLIKKLEKNIDYVGLVHVADVPGRHEPGTGEIDYASIYRKLGELKYNRMVAMEFYPTGNDPVKTLRKAGEDAIRDGMVFGGPQGLRQIQ